MKIKIPTIVKIFIAIILLAVTTKAQTILLDELDGTSLGNANGINYTNTPNGKGAVFSSIYDSNIEYQFDTQIPRQGTLELVIKVESGYVYAAYTFYPNYVYAQIFGTDCDGGDVYWPGSMILRVENNGTITLVTHTSYGGPPQNTFLIATNTNFRYNQWHRIGISYGSQGQYLNLDGDIVAFDTTYSLPMAAAGTWQHQSDKPTIGELTSAFWPYNCYDGGFNGIVDRFRTSSFQKDWFLTVTDIKDEIDNSINYLLYQNYPNPFNPSTTISYSIPKTDFVTLKVYDLLGNEIATLVNEEKRVGNYSIEFDGSKLVSGVYFYTLTAGDFRQTNKMILAK